MIHEYLKERYGEEKVTAVGIITYFGIKLALKEVCRYYRIPVPDANRMTAIVGDLEEIAKDTDGDWHDEVKNLPQDDRDFLEGYRKSYPDLFEKAERMVGLPRQAGKHAAGYVISPQPLAKLLPIRKSDNDEIISQFDKVAVERMGFLKADILGLRNLTTLTLAAKYVKQQRGIDVNFYKLVDDPDDIELWEQFDKGRTLGVFQMEGAGITGVAKELKPRSVAMISIIIALYRPGVIDAGMLDEYIDRAKGEKPVEYVTPLLRPILEETYGVIVFQEQAMAIFSQLAGFTPEEADHIRAAIGKKKMEKILAEKPKFIEGCAKNGVTQEQAEEIFRQIEASGRYSFNQCISGDTVLRRANASVKDEAFPTPDITVEEAYRRFNSDSSVGKKYRDPNRGLWVMAVDKDGRARRSRVKNVYKNGVKGLYRITLSDGRNVKATANHRFMVEGGAYRLVEDMAVGDRLVCCDFEYDSSGKGEYNFTGGRLSLSGRKHPGAKGFPRGSENPGYVDGSYAKHSEYRDSFDGVCEHCGCAVDGRYETHHIDGDRSNNEPDNLANICVPCHKKAHYAMGRTRRGQKGYPCHSLEIVSIERVGDEMTYDVEMDSEEHNFFANGICSHNSHSYAYATISFWTAYMKAHYPLEYYAASMSTVGSEKAPLYMQEARRRGIKIVPPILSNLGRDYTLVSDNEIAFGLTNVRGIGPKAIENILEAAPYEGFEDFVNRSKANSGVVKSMILCGAFREIYPNTRDLMMRYETDDYHTNLFGESLSSENRFACDYERAPFPDERIAEIETELFGMPLTIDPFDKYREMLGPVYDPTQSKEKMDEAAFDTGHVFLVKVQGVRLHMAKNGMMAFVTMVTDKEETIEAVCFSDMFKASQTFLREGRFLRVEILKRQYNGKVSLQINKIQNLEV